MGCGCDVRRAWVRRQLVRVNGRAEQLTDGQVTAVTFGTLGVAALAFGWLFLAGMADEGGDDGRVPVQH